VKKHSCPCGFVFVFGEPPDHEIEAECPKCGKKHVIKPAATAAPANTAPLQSGGEVEK
jgi:predicted  nucleic acid-binding Zn-ribbon protein